MREASPFPNITSRNPFGLFPLKTFLFDQIDVYQGRDVFCLQNIYRGVIRNEAGRTKESMKNKKAFAYTHEKNKQNKTKKWKQWHTNKTKENNWIISNGGIFSFHGLLAVISCCLPSSNRRQSRYHIHTQPTLYSHPVLCSAYCRLFMRCTYYKYKRHTQPVQF